MSGTPIEQYSLHVEWSDEDDAFIATCPEFPGFSAFGETRSQALSEAETALELLVEEMIESGEPLPEPRKLDKYSGQTRLRMPKSLHAALSQEADRQDVSLNTLLVSYLSRQLGRDDQKAYWRELIMEVTRNLKRWPRASMTQEHSDVQQISEGQGQQFQDPLLQKINSGNANE